MGQGRKWRLFIGNLSENVKQEELAEKFDLLLGGKSTQQPCQLGNVEIRCKNDDNYFAFVDVYQDPKAVVENNDRPPQALSKVIDLMNNTKWKGTLIKVQLAKESFLDKLKREREGGSNQSTETTTPNNSRKEESESTANTNLQERPPRFSKYPPRKPANFDFEVVSNKVNPYDKKKQGDENEISEDEEEFNDGIPKFRGLAFCYPNGQLDAEAANITVIKDGDPTLTQEKEVVKPTAKKEPPVPQVSDEDKARFERFQKIAGYSTASANQNQDQNFQNYRRNNFNRVTKFNEEEEEDPAHPAPIVEKLLPLPVPPPAPVVSKGIVFKKHKQQNSDILRQQSLGKLQEIKSHQKDMIKTSLANTNNKFSAEPSEMGESPSKKKQKFDLFDDGGENDDEEIGGEFKLKKQYEGAEGQRLLELRGQWAFDERFNIDERFKEGEKQPAAGEDEDTTEEKRRQMSILSNVLGTTVTLQAKDPTASKTQGDKNSKSVIIKRYDPDADPEANGLSVSKKKAKSTEGEKEIEEEKKEELIRSSEPATYKTAENLKSLFSSEEPKSKTEIGSGGFSLLAAFGKNDEEGEDQTDFKDTTKTEELSSAPRQFWQSNPFKYDSSDDEDDSPDKVKNKKSAKPSLPGAPTTMGKCEFFFKKNDKRFAGVEEYFLKRDEMEGRIDYDEKRRELRTIVKAKARNAKRKDEKRTIAIKRAIRKKKKYRKTVIKSSGVNAVKLG